MITHAMMIDVVAENGMSWKEAISLVSVSKAKAEGPPTAQFQADSLDKYLFGGGPLDKDEEAAAEGPLRRRRNGKLKTKLNVGCWTCSTEDLRRLASMDDYIKTPRLVLMRFPSSRQAEEFAQSRSWPLVSESGSEANPAIRRELSWKVDAGVAFYYVESNLADECCVGLLAKDEGAAAREHQELVKNFVHWTRGQLLAAVANAEEIEERARAVLRVGLGAPVGIDEEFFTCIVDGAQHEDPAVREMALWAMVFPGWPQFRPVLRRIAESDPVDDLRSLAVWVIAAFEAKGVAEP
jgi:hypothetical protein